MDAIGGYFELELRQGEHYHKDAIRLNTARNCFEYILLARKYRKVYIPYYTCEVMLQPLKRLQVNYEFYSIDWNLEPVETYKLKDEEAFLYTNYFGLKQDCVERLVKVYGSKLIVDNAQAFFAPRVSGIDTFYSPRKFFGVPDGGYLYTDCRIDEVFPQDESWSRMSHLLIRLDKGAENGYNAFREHEAELDYASMKRMSRLTTALLQSIDYELIKKRRLRNFKFLHENLGDMNQLICAEKYLNSICPMIYPLMTSRSAELRQKLIGNKIFVATYWPNVSEWCKEGAVENELCSEIVPLPIDQRYDLNDMKRILIHLN